MALAFAPALGHLGGMHRRLVLEEPVSRAALWSRRLALFGLTVVLLAVLIFRFGKPSVERLAPIAGAYVFVLLAFLLSLAAFVRIWQDGHRGVGIAVQAFLLCLLLLAPVAYAGFQLATLPLISDVSTDVDEPPAFSRSRVALAAREGRVPPDLPAERRRAQRQGYPKALPIVLELPAEIAYDIARKACVNLGWRVLEGRRPAGAAVPAGSTRSPPRACCASMTTSPSASGRAPTAAASTSAPPRGSAASISAAMPAASPISRRR